MQMRKSGESDSLHGRNNAPFSRLCLGLADYSRGSGPGAKCQRYEQSKRELSQPSHVGLHFVGYRLCDSLLFKLDIWCTGYDPRSAQSVFFPKN
jgi:hypothetical protein